ncbi:MAG: adenylyl-sulfate kinase [Acidobacteria bacterium]|nr:MAG: adenylyl-sulfate kinase [Acidobacteriota bacterium]
MPETRISVAQREQLNGHRAFALWLTGLSASGKTTLARMLEAELLERKKRCYVLDGDRVRKGLNADLGFSPPDRAENIRRAGEVAKLMVEAGLIVIGAFITPYISLRSMVRSLFPADSFYEIFLDCPLEICEKRDPNGLYRKAREGSIESFTGISAPYEPPLKPDLRLQTSKKSPKECVDMLLDFVLARCSQS